MLKKTYRLRLLLLGVLSLCLFATILVRLYYLQVVDHAYYAKRALNQQNMDVLLTPRRGDILDRNGLPLATSYVTQTIYLDSRKLEGEVDPGAIADLARLLHQPREVIEKYFNTPRRHTLYRKADKEISDEVTLIADRYKLQDVLILANNSKRLYPNGPLASHLIGFTRIDDNGDNIGSSGIELKYDKWLKGSTRNEKVPVTSGRRGLAPLSDEVIESTFGDTVILTIDQRIQMFTEQALRKQVGESQAKGGICLVLDVPTGEILALASCPDFDLNNFGKAVPEQLKNRILTDPVQIGSVMKMITTTLLLDNGLLNPDEEINCQGGRGTVDGRRMTDSHSLGIVPFRMAFADSSNIGLATVGLRLEPNLYYEGLTRFGLGSPTGVDLAGEDGGVLYPVEKWTRLSRTSLPIGYESMLTPLQVIAALGAVGNDGWRLRPHLVKEIRTAKGKVISRIKPERVAQVASPETCKTVRELMEGVVTMGTGDEAKIPGFRIGGKTGTTIKSRPGVTPKTYYASFAGLLPIEHPRLAIYTYVDEPRGEFYGGKIAAPIFQDVALKAAHILSIPPDDPAAFEQAEKLMQRNATPASIDLATTEVEMVITPPAPVSGPFGPLKPLELLDPLQLDATLWNAPIMPDCHGMDIVEAWERLADAGITAQALGSGIVVRQEPPAGEPVRPKQPASIILAHPSAVKKTVSALPLKSAQ